MAPVDDVLERLGAARAGAAPSAALEATYRALAPDDAAALTAHVLERLGAPLVEALLVEWACVGGGLPAAVHAGLLAREQLAPGILFLRAGGATRDALLARLDATRPDEQLRVNHLLRALAFVGDAVVQQRFAAWRDEPPQWAESLHVPPEDYAQEAGWALTGAGGRRDLFLRASLPLVPADRAVAGDVGVWRACDEACRFCGRALIALVDLDLDAERLRALALPTGRLRLATCVACAPWAQLYTEIDLRGGARWRQGNVRPRGLPVDLELPAIDADRLAVGLARGPHAAAHEASPVEKSQVGGHPTWIGDAAFPRCARCDQLMTFVAQIDRAELDPPSEGRFYAFLCATCGLAAATCQQS
jgi:hypothetical protein